MSRKFDLMVDTCTNVRFRTWEIARERLQMAQSRPSHIFCTNFCIGILFISDGSLHGAFIEPVGVRQFRVTFVYGYSAAKLT